MNVQKILSVQMVGIQNYHTHVLVNLVFKSWVMVLVKISMNVPTDYGQVVNPTIPDVLAIKLFNVSTPMVHFYVVLMDMQMMLGSVLMSMNALIQISSGKPNVALLTPARIPLGRLNVVHLEQNQRKQMILPFVNIMENV